MSRQLTNCCGNPRRCVEVVMPEENDESSNSWSPPPFNNRNQCCQPADNGSRGDQCYQTCLFVQSHWLVFTSVSLIRDYSRLNLFALPKLRYTGVPKVRNHLFEFIAIKIFTDTVIRTPASSCWKTMLFRA